MTSFFYAVFNGKYGSGIYDSWEEAQIAVLGKKDCRYKKFQYKQDAELFLLKLSGNLNPIINNNTNKKKERYEVWVDGSKIRNGGVGFGIFFGENHKDNKSISLPSSSTSQYAELIAMKEALEISHHRQYLPITIYSDSMYVIQGITKWLKGWKKNGFRLKSGEPVKYIEIWKQIDDLLESMPGELWFKHVSGHSGNNGNDSADQLARQASSKKIKRIKVTLSDDP